MGILQAAVGLLNKIVVMASTAIGLIIAPNTGVPATTPAIVIQNALTTLSQRVWQVNFQGQTRQTGSIVTENYLASEPLISCNTIDSTSTGMLICGTDATGGGGGNFGTGNVLTINQATDNSTSTGHLINAFKNIFLASSTGSLKATFFPQLLNSSTGALTTLFNTLYLRTSTGSLKTYFQTEFVQIDGDTMTGGLLIVNDGPGTQTIDAGLLLEVAGSASGRIIHAQDELRSSGSLVVDGAATLNSAVNITAGALTNDSILEADLKVVDAAVDEDILTYETTTGDFEWHTCADITGSADLCDGNDASGAGAGNFGTGNVLTIGDNRYVLTQGDTMTGALNIIVTGGNNATVSFETPHTASGRHLHAQDTLTSSGTLNVKGNTILGTTGTNEVNFKADIVSNLIPDTSLQDIGSNTQRWKDLYIRGNVKVSGSYSGSSVFSTKSLTSSGYLTIAGAGKVRGNLSGASLTVNNLLSCNTIDTDASGNLTCGADADSGGVGNFGTGNVLTIGNNRYVLQSGDTMTGGLLIQNGNPPGTIDAGLLLEIAGTASGRILHAQDALHSSGTLTVKGESRFNDPVTISGSRLTMVGSMKDSSYFTPGFVLKKRNGLTGAVLEYFDDGGTAMEFIMYGTGSSTLQMNAWDDEEIGIDSYYWNGNRGFQLLNSNQKVTYFTLGNFNADGQIQMAADRNGTGTYLNMSASPSNTQFLHLGGDAFQFNPNGSDIDFSIEGDTDAALIYANAGTDRVGIGTSNADTKLEVIGTISGSTVYAKNALRSSGTLAWDTTASGDILWVSQFFGANLTDCDADDQTLAWDTSTKKFGCGDDDNSGAGSAWSGTGSLQVAFDTRYVRVAGDTMTGGLLINSTNDITKTIDAGLLLEVAGTASGKRLHAQDLMSASGALSVEGVSTLQGTLTVTDGSSTLFTVSEASGDTEVSGGDLFVTGGDLEVSGGPTRLHGGNVTIGADVSASEALEIIGTASGRSLHAQDGLSSSGTLVWEGTASGAKIRGLGLVDCDTSTTSKLLWDTTLGTFSCGTDTDAQNLFQTIAVSGQSDVVADSTTDTLTLAAGSNVTITTTAGSDTVTIAATDTNTVSAVGQGLLLNSGLLTLNTTNSGSLSRYNTQSGYTIFAKTALRSSGSLAWDGSASGDSLRVSTAIFGSTVDFDAYQSCTALETDSDGTLVCGTDAEGSGGGNFGTGNVLTIGNNRYVLQSGDTMTGGLLIQNGNPPGTIDAGLLLEIAGTASGRTLRALDTLSSSGVLIVKGNTTLRGTLSGAALQIMGQGAAANYMLGNFGIGKSTTAKTKLEVLGTISGSNLFATTNIGASGSLVIDGGSFLKNDLTLGGGNLNFTATTIIGDGGDALTINSNGTLTVQDILDISDNNMTNVGDISLDSLTSDAGTSIIINLGSDAGDDLLIDTNGLVYEGDTNEVGIGTTNPETTLELIGTASGRIIRAQDTLASSGTLSIKGAVTLTNLPSCAFLQSASNGALSCGTTLPVANGGTALSSLPFREIVLTAGGGTPQTQSGSLPKVVNFSTNQVNVQTQDYVGTGSTAGRKASPRYTQWMTTPPDSYNGGTFTAAFNWFTSQTNGNIKWFIQCRSYADGDSIDQAWGTSGSILDTASTTANQMLISGNTGNVTCAGTPAGGKPLFFRVWRSRQDGSDTLSGTGRLVNVKLRYQTSSYSD